MLDRVAVCSVRVAMAGGCIAVGEEGGRAQLNEAGLQKQRQEAVYVAGRLPVTSAQISFARFLLVVASLLSYWCNCELVSSCCQDAALAMPL
jgi:hypothetical protein